MNFDLFKQKLWEVANGSKRVLSATLVGSFAASRGLEGVSDIDLVIIVDRLDRVLYADLADRFDAALRPLVASMGYDLRINPTLGPLKFNTPSTAVLHLMLYSVEAHIKHVVQSPFTCLDWQRSHLYKKSPMAAIYPVFSLQPRHFFGARRSASEYLKDFRDGVVSYRELTFPPEQRSATSGMQNMQPSLVAQPWLPHQSPESQEPGHPSTSHTLQSPIGNSDYQEIRRTRPMTIRDRHEFAYHIMKFLMQNFLKLVQRSEDAPAGEELLESFFSHFPEGANRYIPLFRALQQKKHSCDFRAPVPQLDQLLTDFVQDFETRFRQVFYEESTQHLVFRHARTPANRPGCFLGRQDVDISPLTGQDLAPLVRAAAALNPVQVYSSPLRRCHSSLELLRSHLVSSDQLPVLPYQLSSAGVQQPIAHAPAAQRPINHPPSDHEPSDHEPSVHGSSSPIPPPSPDRRLIEIDYGACDGMSVSEAREAYPEIFQSWEQKEDCPFPAGECTGDVLERVLDFVQDRLAGATGNTIACTHNVVLRCLVGHTLRVPFHLWYRLRIPHLAPFRFFHTARYGLFLDLDEEMEQEVFRDFRMSS